MLLFKILLTSLLIGATSVNALVVARSPFPEPESQQLEARGQMTQMAKDKARTGFERGRNAVSALRGRPQGQPGVQQPMDPLQARELEARGQITQVVKERGKNILNALRGKPQSQPMGQPPMDPSLQYR